MKTQFFTVANTLNVRLEFFGGLLIDRLNNMYYQTDTYNAIVLLLLKYNNDLNNVETFINNKMKLRGRFQKKELLNLTFIRESLSPINTELLTDELAEILLQKIKYVKKNKCLSAPMNISLYPSYTCQAKCKFCFIRLYQHSESKMSYDNVVSIIDQCEKLQVPYVSILGGEPLLLPYIENLIDYMATKPIKFTITTNAIMLRDSFISKLKEYKNINIAISLQSLDEYNVEVTSIPYIDVMDKIKRLSGLCKINTVFYKQSLDQLITMVDFLEQQRIKLYSISVLNDLTLAPEEQIRLYKLFVENINSLLDYVKEKNYNIEIRAEGCVQYMFMHSVERIPKTPLELIFSKCEAGNLKMEITPEGNCIGCMALNSEKYMSGNVFSSTIEEIWLNDCRLNELRFHRCMDLKCDKCNYKNFCNGGCPAQKDYINGNFYVEKDRRCLSKV